MHFKAESLKPNEYKYLHYEIGFHNMLSTINNTIL